MAPSNVNEQLCATHYAPTRDAVLEAYEWSFAIGRATLDTPALPEPDWGMTNAFHLPHDNLKVVWCGQSTNENEYARFDWRIEDDRLVTDQDLVYIRYIRRVEDATKYSPLFVLALAARMAFEMCISVTENVRLQEQLIKIYEAKLGEAVANDGMQGRSQTIKQRVLSNRR
jgi:hypothetical protein